MSYGVYVIGLASGTRVLDHPPLPAVYVGQTWHPFELRFRQHHEGLATGSRRTGSRKILGKCRYLRSELYADLARVEDQDLSIEMEEERADRLWRAGFTVICNGESDRRVPRHELRLFDEAELRGVQTVLADHVEELDLLADRMLSVEDIARVLRWDGTYAVREIIGEATSLAGRYLHVEPDALYAVLEDVCV